MKKKTYILLAVLVLIVLSMLVIPVFLKQPLLEKTKNTINKQFNAQVNFSDLSISFFRDFPKVSAEIKNLSVSGKGKSITDTLIFIPSFRTRFSLRSFLPKNQMALEEIWINQPKLQLNVDTAGNANWDIFHESAPNQSSNETPESENTFQIQLNKITVKNAAVYYNDLSMPMTLALEDLQVNLSGNLYGNSTELQGDASAARFFLNYNSVTYISNTAIKTNTVFNVDFNRYEFRIKESEWWVNQLPFELSGEFSMPNDSMFFNLDFKAKQSGLSDFLALTPPDYLEFVQDVKTEGRADLSGFFKGFLFEEEYPAFLFDFKIVDGKINYTQLPEQIENIGADLKISKIQGDLDLLTLSLKNTHASIAGNPIEINADISSIYSDMNFEFGVKGKIDFLRIKNALPLETLDLLGLIDADIFAKGKYSDIEQKKYENITADGKLQLSNVVYSGKQITRELKIPSAKIEFSPQQIQLNSFQCLTGNSDFLLEGTLSNYLRYFLYDGILSGNFQLSSKNLDLSELMMLIPVDSSAQQTPVDSLNTNAENKTITPFLIPENYDLTFNAAVANSKYENLPISNLRTSLSVKNGNLSVTDFSGKAGSSELKMKIFYGKQSEKTALFSLNATLRSFNLKEYFQALPELAKAIPQAGNAEGVADVEIKLEGETGAEISLKSLSGSANVKNMVYHDPVLIQAVQIPSGVVNFSLDEITLAQLLVKVGKSDFALSGKLSNYMNYYQSKGILEGSLDLKANFLDANELINLQVENKTGEQNTNSATESKTTEATAFTIPNNIQLNFTSLVKSAIYKKIAIENITGLAKVSEGKLNLNELSMKMLEGELKLNGSYANTENNQPDFDFGFAIQSFHFLRRFN